MGRRTGKNPEASDSFIMRVCHALDESPRGLAKQLGIKYTEIEALLNKRTGEMPDPRMDGAMVQLSEYVGEKIGMLLAVRAELDRLLQDVRVQQATRLSRFRRFHDGQ